MSKHQTTPLGGKAGTGGPIPLSPIVREAIDGATRGAIRYGDLVTALHTGEIAAADIESASRPDAAG